MNYKIKAVLLILLAVCHGVKRSEAATKEEKKENILRTTFNDYYSSSLLWRGLAHYFNKSELALPGFSHVFYELSKIDRRHAERVLELTSVHGVRFKEAYIDTQSIVSQAVNKYKSVESGVDKDFPYCKTVAIDEKLINFVHNRKTKDTYLPRALDILNLTLMIENCYMTINLENWKGFRHLEFIIVREFATEQVRRRNYINDLRTKLKDDDKLREFFIDKSLRSTALKY